MSQAQIRISFELPGRPVPSDLTAPQAAGVRLVSPGFFKAIGTRLVAGRDFNETDQAAGERVAIINRVMATRYFGDLDPVGREIDMAGSRRIVGIVESIKPEGFDSQAAPEVFFPVTQFGQLLMAEGPLSATTLVIRTAGDPTSLVPAAQYAAGLDPQLPLWIPTPSQRVSDSLQALYAGVLAIFAGLALVLAAVGIYGVLSSQVEQSTREIGIRIALGAGSARIRRSVLGRGALLAGSGLAIGLAGAWGLSRFISTLLFGITPFDVSTYAASAAALAAWRWPAPTCRLTGRRRWTRWWRFDTSETEPVERLPEVTDGTRRRVPHQVPHRLTSRSGCVVFPSASGSSNARRCGRVLLGGVPTAC
jgi:hypothetical protein